MTAIETISRKRDGHELAEQEIEFLITGYTRGDIPDYQMAAFLMAVYFNGMSTAETLALTRLMRDSGVRLNLSGLPGPKVDKHSTGGVGDKVSLVLAPLVAACGVINPMISGRSLAHTGGTLDKLEAIPGFRTQLDLATFVRHLQARGVCLIGQTPKICPADKKMYALRDATATVQSIPLICGSILSKKLAEDLDALVLDVKCGSGAIFPEAEYAEKLAQALVQTGEQFGLRTVALLTQMAQPLGRNIGTWLETREAIDMLQGRAEDDFAEVTLTLAAYMVWLGGLADSLTAARAQVDAKLHNGEAYRLFAEIVRAQGGDVHTVENPDSYPPAAHSEEITAETGGYVHRAEARTLGEVSMLLGAGRSKKEDGIDYTAGIVLNKKVGDRVAAGDTLCTLCASEKNISPELAARARSAFRVDTSEIASPPPVLGLIDAEGRHAWPPGK